MSTYHNSSIAVTLLHKNKDLTDNRVEATMYKSDVNPETESA